MMRCDILYKGGNQMKILAIDDEPLALEMLTNAIEEAIPDA